MGRPMAGGALEVRLAWASHNVWAAGQMHDGPVHAHTLWLMLHGQAQVSDGADNWDVSPGHVLLWPRDKHRRIVSMSHAGWLSIGLAATASGQADILSLLPLPALHRLGDDESRLLHAWFTQIIDLREAQSRALFEASEEQPDAAQVLGARHDIVSQQPHQMWMARVVMEREPVYDVVENGLALAIVGWCWKLWGPGDLQHALLHQSPRWLQSTLERIRHNPALSVHDLARAAGFSPAHFRRSFHQEMGQSPRDYLQRQRLDLARNLLESTALPISAIAAQAGFSSVPHFTQLWKRAHGTPPHQYRLAQQKGGGRNF